MGFYSSVVFPRVCNWLLANRHVAQERRELLQHASGETLEIGFGTGLNLPFYGQAVEKLVALEPNSGMSALAKRRIEEYGGRFELCAANGERLPFESGSFDCVVSTFTLCSISSAPAALGEAHRVLRTGGRLLFLEHGLSPEPKVQRWQRRMSWLEAALADGCRLDREIAAIVRGAPFAHVEFRERYLPRTPKTHGYLTRGQATK